MTVLPPILVLTDDDTIRRQISSLLTAVGAPLTSARDADEATVRLRQQAFGILLLDITATHERSTTNVRSLRKAAPAAAVVVAGDDRVGDDIIEQALLIGADDFIRLPCSPGELRARMCAAQRARKLQHDAHARTTVFETIAHVAASIAAAADLDTALEAFVHGACTLTGGDYGSVRLAAGPLPDGHDVPVGAPLHAFRPSATMEGRYAWSSETLVAGSIAARLFAAGLPIHACDLSALAAAGNPLAAHAVEQYGARCSLNVALRAGQFVVGTLSVNARKMGTFRDEQLVPLQLLADHAAAAVERLRSQATAAAADARLHALFMQAPTLVAMYRGPDMICEFANALQQELMNREHILGLPVRELLSAEAQSLADIAAHVYTTGVPFVGQELPIKIKEDDATRSFNLTIQPSRDASGYIDGVVTFAVEVTEQVRARQAQQFLAEAGKALAASLDLESTLHTVARLAVPSLADWCIVETTQEEKGSSSPTSRHLAVGAHADPAKEGLVQRLIQRHPLSLHTEYGAPVALRSSAPLLITEASDTALRDHVHDAEELRLWREAGIASYMYLPLVARGHVRGSMLLAVATPNRRYGDRELVLAEQLAHHAALAIDQALLYRAMQEASAWSEAVVDGAPSAIFIVGEDSRFVRVNESAVKLTGYPRQELVGMEVSRLIRQPADRAVSTMARQRGAGTVLTVERTLFRKDDTPVVVELRAAAVAAPGGSTIVVVAAHDLTARKEMERHLATSEKLRAIGQLATGVAHDINNNLAAILGPARLAREALTADISTREALIDDLTFIERAAQDAAHTVRRLQLFARHSRGEPVSERSRVYPDELLDDVIALTRPRWRDQAQADGQQISVVTHRGQPPAILADAAELREAMVNLITNAADALPSGGTITMTTDTVNGPAGGNDVVLSVADTGMGMDPAVQAHIFEPFFTTKPLGKGTGLGLAMVQGIVENLGGQIRVVSRPGMGTTFTIRIPAAPEAELPTPPAPTEVLAQWHRSLHLLVVEDETALRNVLRRMLQRAGHQVTMAGSAEEAIVSLQQAQNQAPFDVVITDVGLPGVSGWQLAREIAAHHPHLPVVIASGWATLITDAELAAVSVPRAHVVAKPYRAEELAYALAAAMPNTIPKPGHGW